MSLRQHELIATVARMGPAMQARAAALDEGGLYPVEDMAELVAAGGLLAPFPVVAGGMGLGTTADGATALTAILTAIGLGNLAVGRLFEGHVNAVRLISRYGTADQVRRAAADATAGHVFGLWVTDAPGDGLKAGADGLLQGGKAFCSGAGHAGRAVVTIDDGDATRLAYVSTEGTAASPLEGRLHGMRAARTGKVSFAGGRVEAGDWLGAPGDYLREPDFSAGAWRTSAVTCGGLVALVGEAMRQLVARGRADNPHQQARMGRAWIAQETALLWLDRAATAAEGAPDNPASIVATVNFARIAIESACLEAMVLVERSLGLAAFVQPNPIERMRRDLATYLRQPAGDEVLTEAAAHVMRAWAPTA